jgi:hypothetical protein
MLIVLGSGITSFRCFVSCLAALYAGLFLQLTMRRAGLSGLCSFMVPCTWCFWIHICVFPFICLFYYGLACVYGCS